MACRCLIWLLAGDVSSACTAPRLAIAKTQVTAVAATIFFVKFMITRLLIICFIECSHRFRRHLVPMRYRDHGASRGLALWYLSHGAFVLRLGTILLVIRFACGYIILL